MGSKSVPQMNTLPSALTAMDLFHIVRANVDYKYTYSSFISDVLSSIVLPVFQQITPTGSVDGVNDVFVFPGSPSLIVLDGQILLSGTGYSLSGNTATFTTPPFSGSIVWGYGTF